MLSKNLVYDEKQTKITNLLNNPGTTSYDLVSTTKLLRSFDSNFLYIFLITMKIYA